MAAHRWRPWQVAVGMVSLGAVLLLAPSGFYALAPGAALEVAPLVRLNAPEALADGGGPGRFLLTAIAAREASPALVLRALFDPFISLVPRTAFLPRGHDLAQFRVDADRLMEESQSLAALAAERFLGLPASLEGAGVLVLGVHAGPAREAGLQRGDRIVRARHRQVRDGEDLWRFLLDEGDRAAQPGFYITVARGGREVRLPFRVEGRSLSEGPGLAALGMEGVTASPRYRLPVPVTFRKSDVAGPSAGLAFALEVADRLDGPRDLAGGRKVAVTGTIWPSGRVGPVGGVGFKAEAARQAGARVFLVPRADLAEARRRAGDMTVIGVESLGEAVAALKRLSGPTGP